MSIQAPIFIQTDDFNAFQSVADAERYYEPWSLETPMEAFDSTGLRLRLRADPVIRIEPDEDSPSGRERLDALLRNCLEELGTLPEWIQGASHEELVREGALRRATR